MKRRVRGWWRGALNEAAAGPCLFVGGVYPWAMSICGWYLFVEPCLFVGRVQRRPPPVGMCWAEEEERKEADEGRGGSGGRDAPWSQTSGSHARIHS